MKRKDGKKKIWSESHRQNMSISRTASGNGMWGGDNAGYSAIHKWVTRHKGIALKCEKCGATRDSKRIEWANKDHKYKRSLDDYMALCVPHHKEYDSVELGVIQGRKQYT